MKYSRAALRRGAPRPQNAEANSPRGRQVRASADKTDPRRASADKADPRRSIGGQGRPAPQHRRTRQTRAAASADKADPRRSCPGSATCVLYLTFYTLSSPFFWFYFPRFARPSPSLYGFPLPFYGSPPPAGRRRKGGTLPQGPPRQKSGGSPCGLPPCLVSVVQRGRDSLRPAAAAAASDLSRPAAARGADSVPKQTRKKPRRRGTGRTVGNARRGNNAAARRSDAVSPPLLPQSAGAQTRRAGAYT